MPRYIEVGVRKDGTYFTWTPAMEKNPDLRKARLELPDKDEPVKASVPVARPQPEQPKELPIIGQDGVLPNDLLEPDIIKPTVMKSQEQADTTSSTDMEIIQGKSIAATNVEPLTELMLEDMKIPDIQAECQNRFGVAVPSKFRSKGEIIDFVLNEQTKREIG